MRSVTLDRPTITDVPALLRWMAEFNTLEGMAFDRAHVEQALRTLLREPKLGEVVLLSCDELTVGYAVLTWTGDEARLTELFLQPAARRRGIGVRVLELLHARAKKCGARALRLAVGSTPSATLRTSRRQHALA